VYDARHSSVLPNRNFCADGDEKRKSAEDAFVHFVVVLNGRGDAEGLHGDIDMLMANVQRLVEDRLVLPNAFAKFTGSNGPIQQSFVSQLVFGDVVAQTFGGRFDFAGDRAFDVSQGHGVHFQGDCRQIVCRGADGGGFDDHHDVQSAADVLFRDEVQTTVGLEPDAAQLAVDDIGQHVRH